MPDGPTVRGRCKRCGHELTTKAPHRRVTWKGPCPECGTPMLCRRIPTPPAPAAEPSSSSSTSTSSKIREVSRYSDDEPDPATFTDPAELELERTDEPGGGERPAGVSEPAAEAGPGPADDVVDVDELEQPDVDEQPELERGPDGRERRRWRWRRAVDDEPAGDRAQREVIPGIY